MPRVFRKTYSRPIPEGAQRVTLRRKVRGREVEGPAVRFKGPDGKAITAPLTEAGDRCLITSPTWYGRVPGEAQPVPLCANKAAAEIMLGERCRKAEMGQADAVDPYEAHRKRPLTEHLADWEAELRTGRRGKRRRPPAEKQVALKVGRVRRVLDGCGFRLPGDVTLLAVQEFLHGLTVGRPVAIDPKQEEFTLAEIAEALGIARASVAPLVARRSLAALGNGKARRFPRATLLALLAHRARGVGTGTAGYYAREAKAFTRWLVRRGRLAGDPLADLPGAAPDQSDHRHDRRTPTEAELRGVIAAAHASPRAFRDLSGRARAMLYATAAASGFRVDELASLAPEDFDLAGAVPVVTLRGDVAKNGRTATQPLPSDLAEALRRHLAGLEPGRPVWPGTWVVKAAAMLRRDLEAANIPYATDGPEGPLYLDFHALRHGYVALLDRAGATLKEAMQLARHSDPKLTMARYGRAHLHDLAAAVGRMPSLLPEEPSAAALRLTGTDATPPLTSDIREGKPSGACTLLAQPAAGDCHSVRVHEGGSPAGEGKQDVRNHLELKGVADDCGQLMAVERSSGDWI